MSALFYLLAAISYIAGLIQIYTAWLDNSLMLLFIGFVPIINGFAWYLVGELWGNVDNITEQIHTLEEESKYLYEKIRESRKKSE